MPSHRVTSVRFFPSAVLMLLALASGCQEASPPVAPAAAPRRLATGGLPFVASYAEGRALATQQKKPLLLFFTATWCHYCHELADEVFSQESVVQLADRFVCVLVDADREANLCREFHVNRFPTVQFVSPNGAPLNRLTGKKPAHQVIMEMQSALQTIAHRAHTGVGRR